MFCHDDLLKYEANAIIVARDAVKQNQHPTVSAVAASRQGIAHTVETGVYYRVRRWFMVKTIELRLDEKTIAQAQHLAQRQQSTPEVMLTKLK
jgi:hypothetical protein